jgi:16S rRNA (uracil1498-N3)-methyltransferase
VNLVLFEPADLERPLAFDDPRAVHVTRVLRREPGQPFDAGLVDGPRGKAMLKSRVPGGWELEFAPAGDPPPLHPVSLLFGSCRPVAAQRILREATSLGAEAIWTFAADKAEAGYLEASLWSGGEWREHLLAGAMQAFSTRLPAVRVFASLDETLAAAAAAGIEPLALDNYEAERPLREWAPAAGRTAVAVGPERGWSARERALMRGAGVALCGLGERVLRAETACLAGLALVLARRGLL